ncbi:MAG: restriction endonuclease, partial [Planctomycetota bacterium]|nr:restriction endonuclease [Planctomycetota bacterium]
MKTKLTIDALKIAAADFAEIESNHGEPTMYGVTDGKAVGTYLEHKFRLYLAERFTFEEGNSAK